MSEQTNTFDQMLVSAEELFGAESQLVVSVGQGQEGDVNANASVNANLFTNTHTSIEVPSGRALQNQHPLSSTIVYQGLLVLLFLVFFYVTYVYREILGVLAKVVLRRSYLQRLYRERSNLFKQFMRKITMVGGLMVALLAVRVAEKFLPITDLELEYPWAIPLMAIVLTLAIYIYRILVIRIIAFVGDEALFFKEHSYIVNMFWVLGVMLVTPIFVFWGGFTLDSSNNLMFEVLGVIVGLNVLMCLCRSYLFFVGQKVSNLQWILYLCAVDLFPLSLLASMWTI